MDKQMFLDQIQKLKKIQYIISAVAMTLILTAFIIAIITVDNKDGIASLISLSLILWIPLVIVSGAGTIFGTMLTKPQDQRYMVLTIIGSLGLMGLSVLSILAFPIIGIAALLVSVSTLVIAIIEVSKGWSYEVKFGGRPMY